MRQLLVLCWPQAQEIDFLAIELPFLGPGLSCGVQGRSRGPQDESEHRLIYNI